MIDRSKFLENSISDTQATIRALDTKAVAFLAFLSVPMVYVHEFVKSALQLFPRSQAAWLLVLVQGVIWFAAFLSMWRTIFPRVKPTTCIAFNKRCEGQAGECAAFKAGECTSPLGLFFDSRCGIQTVGKPCSVQFVDVCGRLFQLNEQELEKELLFEQLKLGHIRDQKLITLKWGLLLIAVYVVIHLLTRALAAF